MSVAMDILDRTISLKPGEKLRLHLSSYEEMKSLKTSLYRERNKYEEKFKTGATQIVIKQEKKPDGSYLISLFTMSGSSHSLSAYGAEILTAEGDIKDVAPAEQLNPQQDFEEEQERIRKLMKEDGMSDDEIDNILKGE